MQIESKDRKGNGMSEPEPNPSVRSPEPLPSTKNAVGNNFFMQEYESEATNDATSTVAP